MTAGRDSGSDFSLQQLSKYVADNVEGIGRVRQEVEEIQIGFNSAYVEWKAQHDAALERLATEVIAKLEDVGPELRARVEDRSIEERSIITERYRELSESFVHETQAKADKTLQEGQDLGSELRKLNPRLDRREEKLKGQRAALKGELAQLNEQIRRLSGCLSLIFSFLRLNRLGRQRQQVIGQLKVIQQEIKGVREEWQEAQVQTQSQHKVLQDQWQGEVLKLAQLQRELDYLDDEANRDGLALERAAHYVVDNLKEPITCPADDVKRELDAMVTLNIRTDNYHEGLGSVSSFMSVLDGIIEGLSRYNESVQGLIEEQRMHSSYLPKLSIRVPGEVLAFHQHWDSLTQKVRDDHQLCAHPAEFVAAVRPVMEKDLAEANVKVMFEGLGQALKQATNRWRG